MNIERAPKTNRITGKLGNSEVERGSGERKNREAHLKKLKTPSRQDIAAFDKEVEGTNLKALLKKRRRAGKEGAKLRAARRGKTD